MKTPGVPGWLGLAIDDSLVPGRLVVVEVDAGGPASKSGVQLQDMVLAIDGEPTLDADRFAAAIATIAPGDTVRFSIARGGAVEEVAVLAAESPKPVPPQPAAVRSPEPPVATGFSDPIDPPARSAFGQPPSPFPADTAATSAPASTSPPASMAPPAVSVSPFSEPSATRDPWQGSTGSPPSSRQVPAESGRGKTALGVRTVPVDQVAQARYSLAEPTGALVVGLVDDLPASRAGLPTGSVIVAFDRQPVRSPTELTKLVSEGPTDRPVKLEYVLPGGESRAAEVSLVSVPLAVSQPEPVPVSAAGAVSAGEAVSANVLGAEIRELRRTIESLTRRLDDLERRALEQR